MFARIAHDLRRGIEPHRLGIEQRTGKDRRVMAFEPGARIDQMRETGGMALGKAIAAKALDLGKTALGEIIVIPVGLHALQKPRAKLRDIAMFLESGQRPAQTVRLFGREPRADDGNLHRLFLKERHAQRLAQHPPQFIRRETHRLFAIPPADEGMHHIALNGTGRMIAT